MIQIKLLNSDFGKVTMQGGIHLGLVDTFPSFRTTYYKLPNEVLITSKSKDMFGNKDCYQRSVSAELLALSRDGTVDADFGWFFPNTYQNPGEFLSQTFWSDAEKSLRFGCIGRSKAYGYLDRGMLTHASVYRILTTPSDPNVYAICYESSYRKYAWGLCRIIRFSDLVCELDVEGISPSAGLSVTVCPLPLQAPSYPSNPQARQYRFKCVHGKTPQIFEGGSDITPFVEVFQHLVDNHYFARYPYLDKEEQKPLSMNMLAALYDILSDASLPRLAGFYINKDWLAPKTPSSPPKPATVDFGMVAPPAFTTPKFLQRTLGVWNQQLSVFSEVAPQFCVKHCRVSDLGLEVASNLNRFDSNMIAYFADLPKLGDTVKSVMDFARDPSLKTAASAWLGYRFGDRLSLKDSEELFNSFLSVEDAYLARAAQYSDYLSGRARKSYSEDGISGWTSYQATFAPKDYNGLMKLIRKAFEWDVFPTLENTWDMIPLSFVVDWVLNVGEILNALDQQVRDLYYDFVSGIETYSAKKELEPLPANPAGKLVLVPMTVPVMKYYHRSVNTSEFEYDLFPARLSLPSTKNIVDAFSLLVG